MLFLGRTQPLTVRTGLVVPSKLPESHRERGWWSPQPPHRVFRITARLPPQPRPLFDVWAVPKEYGRVTWFDSGYLFMRHLKDFTFLHESGHGS